MEDYDGAILSDDQQVDLLSAWAACYRNKEEYHTAEERYKQALELNKQTSSILNNHAINAQKNILVLQQLAMKIQMKN